MSTSDNTSWFYRNESGRITLVLLEPHGQEIRVPPGSQLLMRTHGGVRPESGESPFEASFEGDTLTVWAQWTGSEVSVFLDGEPV
jgi:hypothetical protein